MEEDLKINALERPYAPERDAVPLRWEPEYVGRKLVAAFVTLDRLPRVRGPRDPGRHWPEHAVEWADQLAHAELDDAERRAREFQQNRTILRPTSADIAGMDAAFDWLRELRRVDPGMALVTSSLGALFRPSPFHPPALHRQTLGAAYALSQTRQGARPSRPMAEGPRRTGVLKIRASRRFKAQGKPVT